MTLLTKERIAELRKAAEVCKTGQWLWAADLLALLDAAEERDALRKERDEARQSGQHALRMCDVHRQNALGWEKSARALDVALVAATSCEPRYDYGENDEEEEIAF